MRRSLKILTGHSRSPPLTTFNMKTSSFDIDGVIYLGEGQFGLFPGPNDVIITGRSIEECDETYAMLHARGIYNLVFFNHIPWEEKTREKSGLHKANTLVTLNNEGMNIGVHFEDDPVQAKIIETFGPPDLRVIMIGSGGMVPLENVRHK